MPVITLGQDQDDVCYLTHHILTGKARLRLSKWNENSNDYSITKKRYMKIERDKIYIISYNNNHKSYVLKTVVIQSSYLWFVTSAYIH